MVQLANQAFNLCLFRTAENVRATAHRPCLVVECSLFAKNDDEVYAFIYASKFSNYAHKDNFVHK
jgi:hypothetical protein